MQRLLARAQASRSFWAAINVASASAAAFVAYQNQYRSNASQAHRRRGSTTSASADSTFDSQFKDATNNRFVLPPLPYSSKAELEPVISANTVDFHYHRHHAGYVNRLNELTSGSDYAKMSLEELIKKERQGKVFNLAAQVWNHTFYWSCMQSPKQNGKPNAFLTKAIEEHFGSVDKFKQQFATEALSHFGSGWAWLVQDPRTRQLKVISTHDAANPLTMGLTPLLTIDVWEHAYYLDYKNDRQKYIDQWWSTVNWDFVAKQMK